MTQTRRRFLAITAASAASPLWAETDARWQGHAFGAQVDITLYGPPDQTGPALRAARKTLRQVETRFSLYDPTSELSRLNATGLLSPPSPMMQSLVAACTLHHAATDGLFDPSVQPLWLAMANGVAPMPLIRWNAVEMSAQRLSLAAGQRLTFNGIAQGFATDLVRDTLSAHGMTRALVNIGEFAAIGGPFVLGLEDPKHGLMGRRTLTDTAIATSSPAAMTLQDGVSHILNPDAPDAPPKWSTVSIEARTATQADALSTALIHGDIALARRLRALPDIRRITLIDHTGDLVTL